MSKISDFFHISDNLLITGNGYILSVFQVNLDKDIFLYGKNDINLKEFYEQIFNELKKYFLYIYYDKENLDIKEVDVFVFKNHFALVFNECVPYTKLKYGFKFSLFNDDLENIVQNYIEQFNKDIEKVMNIAKSFNISLTNLSLKENEHSESISFLMNIIYRDKLDICVNKESYHNFQMNDYIETDFNGVKRYHAIMSIKNRGIIIESAKILLSKIDVVITEIVLSNNNVIHDEILFNDIYSESTEGYLNVLLLHVSASSAQVLGEHIEELNLVLKNFSFVHETFLADIFFLGQISFCKKLFTRSYFSNEIFLLSSVKKYFYGLYKTQYFDSPITVFNQEYGNKYFFNINDLKQHVLIMTADIENKLLNIMESNIDSQFPQQYLLSFRLTNSNLKLDQKVIDIPICDESLFNILEDIINHSYDQTVVHAKESKDTLIQEVKKIKNFNFQNLLSLIEESDKNERKVFLLLEVLIKYFLNFNFYEITGHNKILLSNFVIDGFYQFIIANHASLFFYIDQMMKNYDRLRLFIFKTYIAYANNIFNSKTTFHILLYDFDQIISKDINEYIFHIAQQDNIILFISINTFNIEYSQFEYIINYFNKFIFFKIIHDLEINIDSFFDKEFLDLKNYDNIFFYLGFKNKKIILSHEDLR